MASLNEFLDILETDAEVRLVLHQFYCPGCLALLNTEVAQRGEPIVWDVEVAA